MPVLNVIAIDPGSEKSAFVWWTGKEILDKGIHPNHEILEILDAMWREPSILVIEKMSHITKGGKSIVDTLLWAGQFYHAWHGQKVFVERYKVTLALTGKMPSKESDKLVKESLIRRFGGPGTKKNPGPVTYGLKSHLWQAFGLAVAHWDHLEFQGKQMK